MGALVCGAAALAPPVLGSVIETAHLVLLEDVAFAGACLWVVGIVAIHVVLSPRQRAAR